MRTKHGTIFTKSNRLIITHLVEPCSRFACEIDVWKFESSQRNTTRKDGNYSDVLPLKVARRDNIRDFKSELQRNQCRFMYSACGASRGCRIEGVGWTGTKQNSEGG